jgi:protein phosphatase
LWNNKKTEHGPFDIIGDVHGCADELELLLKSSVTCAASTKHFGILWAPGDFSWATSPTVGRRVVDALNRDEHGARGAAWCVLVSRREMKRYLSGKSMKITHGLQRQSTICNARATNSKRSCETGSTNASRITCSTKAVWVVAHAGLKTSDARGARRARFARLFVWRNDWRNDEWGLPERLDWARDYRGKAAVVYGHTPVPNANWLNNTLNVDTGCVFGGA